MKKAMISMLVVMGFGLSAQEDKDKNERTDYRERLLFGIKGGVNYSNVYDSEGESFEADPKLGVAAGAFLAIPIGKYFGIQPEFLLSQKGFHATGKLLGSTYDLTRTTTYIDVPILFALKPGEFFTFLVGPQYAYLIRQNDQFKNTTTTIEQETVFENDNIRKNTLCFLGGVDLTMKHVVIGLRAGWDLQRNNGDGTSATPRYKNAWYQATLGYRFFKE